MAPFYHKSQIIKKTNFVYLTGMLSLPFGFCSEI